MAQATVLPPASDPTTPLPKDYSMDDLIKSIKGSVGKEVVELVEKRFALLEEQNQQNPLYKKIAAGEPIQVENVEREKGLGLSKMVRALAHSKGDIDKAVQFAESQWPEDEAVHKAISAGNATEGGVLVPAPEAGEMIELLRPASVFMNAGPRIIPMDRGALKMPKLKGGATAYWIGENEVITVSEPDFGQLNMVFKKLVGLIPISNDFLRFASPGSDAIIRDDLVATLATAKDVAFLRGDGLANSPKGLRSWALASQTNTANGTVNLANVTEDLGTFFLELDQANIALIKPHVFIAPRTEWYLRTVRDGNGNLAFEPQMSQGMLFGYPYSKTNNIPINLDTTDSELIGVDMADAIVGTATGLMIDASNEAAYDDNGTVRAAFSQDQTVVRIIEETDLGMRHAEAITILTEVTWAP